jgi:uncharacterized protein
MAKKTPIACELPLPLHDRQADTLMALIRGFARKVAERFHPERIILFGSHAYGTPHADSDVDILIIMPARNQHDQAIRIRWEVPAPFPLDLLARTPQNMHWRLEEGDSFLREIVSKGKVLYEKVDARVDQEGRDRSRRRRAKQSERHTPT